MAKKASKEKIQEGYIDSANDRNANLNEIVNRLVDLLGIEQE